MRSKIRIIVSRKSKEQKGALRRMHELSVVYPIVKMASKIAASNGIEHVAAVRLAVGEMHDLQDEWVIKYYKKFSAGTPLEGSELKMRRIPIVYRCRRCGHELSFTHFEFAGAETVCTACGSPETDLVSGRELQIEGLEFHRGENQAGSPT